MSKTMTVLSMTFFSDISFVVVNNLNLNDDSGGDNDSSLIGPFRFSICTQENQLKKEKWQCGSTLIWNRPIM